MVDLLDGDGDEAAPSTGGKHAAAAQAAGGSGASAAAAELAAAHSPEALRIALLLHTALLLRPGEGATLERMMSTPHLAGQAVEARAGGGVVGQGCLDEAGRVACGCGPCTRGCAPTFWVTHWERHCDVVGGRPGEAVVLQGCGRSVAQLLALVNSPHLPAAAAAAHVDVHSDRCHGCGECGDLLCCDGCTCCLHLACAGLSQVPEGDWYCPLCVAEHAALTAGAPQAPGGRRQWRAPAAPSEQPQQPPQCSAPAREALTEAASDATAVLAVSGSQKLHQDPPPAQRDAVHLPPAAAAPAAAPAVDRALPQHARPAAQAPAADRERDAKRTKLEDGGGQAGHAAQAAAAAPSDGPAEAGGGGGASLRLVIRRSTDGAGWQVAPPQMAPPKLADGAADVKAEAGAAPSERQAPAGAGAQQWQAVPPGLPPCQAAAKPPRQPGKQAVCEPSQPSSAGGGPCQGGAAPASQRRLFMSVLAMLRGAEVPATQLQAFLMHYAGLPALARPPVWQRLQACCAAEEARAFVRAALGD